jgi:hypothetical protein
MQNAHRAACGRGRWRRQRTATGRELCVNCRDRRNPKDANAVVKRKRVNVRKHGTATEAVNTFTAITFVRQLRVGCGLCRRMATGTSRWDGALGIAALECPPRAIQGARQQRSGQKQNLSNLSHDISLRRRLLSFKAGSWNPQIPQDRFPKS